MAEKSLKKMLFHNFLGGIATAMGATVGFAIVIWLVSLILHQLGGLPIVGNFFASIVDATNDALKARH